MARSSILRLRNLEEQSQRIRDRLKIASRGEVLFQATMSVWPERNVVVEADGLGGAKLLVVEGNYPVDYMIYRETQFTSEEEACEAAEKLLA